MKNKKAKHAFTLAEALITMAIIGVIAALTIPGMKNNSDERSFVSAVKKAYVTAQDATSALEVQHGNSELWDWTDKNAIKKRYYNVMNGMPLKIGNYDILTLDNTKWTTVTATSADGAASGWFQTLDGMLWLISDWTDGSGSSAKTYNLMYVDTNGASMPNRVGIDVHCFVVTKDGLFPMGAKMHYGNSYWACTNYAVKKGAMPWIGDTTYKNCADARVTDAG